MARIIEDELNCSSSIISIVISGSEAFLDILEKLVSTKNKIDFARIKFFVIPEHFDCPDKNDVFNTLMSLHSKVFFANKCDSDRFCFNCLNDNFVSNEFDNELCKVDMFFLWIDSDDSIFNSILKTIEIESNQNSKSEIIDSITSNSFELKYYKLAECNNNIFLSSGIKNKKLIASILSEDYKKEELSLNILFRGKKNRTWIIDKEAGSMLW
ncbi:MAG: hypothetical protein IPO21_04665 [Bacteroidales bacterium]|nr:hypothetical protein [Bacteroidales bacterium]